MNFALEQGNMREKLPKMAVVTGLHILLFGFIATGVHYQVSPPSKTDVTVLPPKAEEPPPQPKPLDPVEPKIQPKTEDVYIPAPEVVTNDPPPLDPPFTKSTTLPPVGPPHTGGGTDPVIEPREPKLAATPKQIIVPAVIDAHHCTKPDYPANSARLGHSGTTTLSMLVGSDGLVVDAKVVKTSGHRELDQAARQGLSLCKFKPGTIDGVPQQLWTEMRYEWQLDE